jgi:hypothetical protein
MSLRVGDVSQDVDFFQFFDWSWENFAFSLSDDDVIFNSVPAALSFESFKDFPVNVLADFFV